MDSPTPSGFMNYYRPAKSNEFVISPLSKKVIILRLCSYVFCAKANSWSCSWWERGCS